MTIRLKLVCHAATAAVRSYAFPADEPLDPHGQRRLAAVPHGLAPAARDAEDRSMGRVADIGHANRCWTSPSLRARQTAEILKLDATVEPMLRDCGYGRWIGRTFEDVQAQEPDALAAWLHDPDAAPHGGESLLSLLARVAGWLDGQGRTSGKTVAVTHASVIRAAVVHAIDATPRSFWRIDIAPLSVTTLSGHHGRWTLCLHCAVARRWTVRRLAAGCTGRAGTKPFRSCPGLTLALRLGCLLPCLILAAPAGAHHQTASHAAAADEISIPTISHGQMVVLAESRSAILDLAARQIPADRVMRRLQGYIAIQFSACLWGLVPGSLTDEDSPFNECTHAYLAAARALLMHLQEMPGDREPVRALATRIETEMLRRQASLVMCRYSDESFSTSDVIYPDWSLLRSHIPGLAVLMTIVSALAGGALAVVRWKPGICLHRADRQDASES